MLQNDQSNIFKKNKFDPDDIADVKVTEVVGEKIQREVFEQRTINGVTNGVGAQSNSVLNKVNPIGPARAGAMSQTISTGKTIKMN